MDRASEEPSPVIAAASHILKLFLAGVFVSALALGMLSPALSGALRRILAEAESPATLASVSAAVDVVGSLAGGLLAAWVYGRPRPQ